MSSGPRALTAVNMKIKKNFGLIIIKLDYFFKKGTKKCKNF